MEVKFRHLGTVRTCADPVMGFYVHDYICEDVETGRIERIRDEDYLVDGTYDVSDDFFETHVSEVELEEDVW